MDHKDETVHRGQPRSVNEQGAFKRTLPIIHPPPHTISPLPSPGDPMDVASPSHAMGPPSRSSPDESEGNGVRDLSGEGGTGAGLNAAAAAQAGAGQAPKVVQTAFIHKLYNMLEDQNIQHLISWSNSAESFVMSPSTEFSKVLSQYFKHTNISSFVRQLNMYGFHKVSDVFQTGSPESTLWEFKHGNGNFKRGDLVGLREIKRRASRHALVHRESYPVTKPLPYSQPGIPQEPIQPIPETGDNRVYHMEQGLSDMYGRLHHCDNQIHGLYQRNEALREALARSIQLNGELSRVIVSAITNPQSGDIHRTMHDIQSELSRISESIMRPTDEQQEPPFSSSRPYFSELSLNNAPVSPHQLAQDDPRRPPPQMMPQPPRHQQPYRPALPAHLSVPPRRYGSIGNGSAALSPSSLRYQTQPPPPPPPPQNHLLTKIQQSPPMSLARRHTSADIRETQGWRPVPSPFASGHASTQWPSSPERRPSVINEDQRIRDSFSSYSLTAAQGVPSNNHPNDSRPTTPPPYLNGSHPNQSGSAESLGTWAWGANKGDRFGGSGFTPGGLLAGGIPRDGSIPPTRRGSMAHILNPAETAERDEDEEDVREDDRKRKRIV